VFDDSYYSIWPAIEAMHDRNMAGNVAVIGIYASQNKKGYLSRQDLHKIQDEYGWSVANHTWFHKDVLTAYAAPDLYHELDSDILRGAEFLVNNGLNSAPNWFIFPHGTVNQKEIEIISKYYKFSRTTQLNPEAYPFVDPYRVKTFGVQNDTSVADVEKAIDDAVNFKQTLFLTFHRINARPTDRPGYPIKDFEQILDYLVKRKANVMSFAQFDESNGVSANKITIPPNISDQLSLDFQVVDNSHAGLYKLLLIITVTIVMIILVYVFLVRYLIKTIKPELTVIVSVIGILPLNIRKPRIKKRKK